MNSNTPQRRRQPSRLAKDASIAASPSAAKAAAAPATPKVKKAQPRNLPASESVPLFCLTAAFTYYVMPLLLPYNWDPVAMDSARDYPTEDKGKEFCEHGWSHFQAKANPVLTALALVYLPGLWYLKSVMATSSYKAGRTQQRIKFCWNVLVALCSIVAARETVPYALNSELTDLSWLDTRARIYVLFFNVTKAAEFMDTLFLVLARREIIFLHAYHHITVMLYCWYASIRCGETAHGIYFAAMNLSVHSIMYGYYALRTAGFQWLARIAIYVTSLQILQMFVGIGIAMVALWQESATHTVHGTTLVGALMYGSYAVLFLHYFITRYTNFGKRKD